jgi:hypothetical protein
MARSGSVIDAGSADAAGATQEAFLPSFACSNTQTRID